jgi:hypothetical protein
METDLLTIKEMADRLKIKICWLYRRTKGCVDEAE